MRLEMIRINDIYHYIGKGHYVIVDLREEKDYRKGHIPNAINLPYETTKDLPKLLMKYQQIFLYCYTGSHSLMAARDLQKLNSEVYNLSGGITVWKGSLVK